MVRSFKAVLFLPLFAAAPHSYAQDTLITIDSNEINIEQVERVVTQKKPLLIAQPSENQVLTEIKQDYAWVDLPLEPSGFIIDKTINEFVLTLDKEDSYYFRLVNPLGEKISVFDKDKNFVWDKSSQKFTLRYQQPMPGQWSIEGTDKPIQLKVHSVLTLQADKLPKNMMMGEVMPLSAHLAFKNKIIRNEQLKYTQIFAIIHHLASQKKYKIFLKDNGMGIDKQKGDGVYGFQYRLHYVPGLHEITYHAIGLSFKRTLTQQVYVHEYPGQVSAQYDLSNERIKVQAKIDSVFIDPQAIRLQAYFYQPGGSVQTFLMNKQPSGIWTIEAPSKSKWSFDKIIVQISGQNKAGKFINVDFAPIDVLALYQIALDKQSVRKRAEILAKDSFELGHVLSISREKLAQEYAEVAYQNHYKQTFPKPRKFYQTLEQRRIAWWQKGEQAKSHYSVGMSNIPKKGEVIDDTQLLEQTDPKLQQLSAAAQKPIEPVAEPKSSMAMSLLKFCIFIFLIISLTGMGVAIWFLTGKKPIPLPGFIKARLNLFNDAPDNVSTESGQEQFTAKKKFKLPKKAKSKTHKEDLPDTGVDGDALDESEEEPPHEIAENLKSPPKPPPKQQKGIGIQDKDKPKSFGPIPMYQEQAKDAPKQDAKEAKKEPCLSEEDKNTLLSKLKEDGPDSAPKEGAIAATSSLFYYEDDDDELTEEEHQVDDALEQEVQSSPEQITMPEDNQARDGEFVDSEESIDSNDANLTLPQKDVNQDSSDKTA